MALDIKWLVLAGALGAAAAVVAMRPATPTAGPRPQVAAAVPAASPASPADPWSTASRRPPHAPAAVVAPAASTGPSDPNAPLDDAGLAKRAREVYGLECAGVVARDPPRNGFYMVTCVNGFRYRVYETPGELPVISEPPTRVRTRRAPSADE